MERYTPADTKFQQALEEIFRLEIPLADWESLEEEVAQGHCWVPLAQAHLFEEDR